MPQGYELPRIRNPRVPIFPARQFTALVLAADRTADDPVTRHAGVACKAFAPTAGVPMILRVLDALQSSAAINKVILCGPPASALPECPALNRRVGTDTLAWRPNHDSPSRSAEAGLADIDPSIPVLLTTADHALLRTDIVNYFLQESLATGADVTVALVRHQAVRALFPATRRTVLRMRDGHFCGCNLYALLSPGARRIVPFWRNVEQRRKHPGRIIAGLLGVTGLLAYALGRLDLDRAFQRISGRLNLDLRTVILPFAEAGVDVDTVDDLRLVESVLSRSPVDSSGN